MFVAPVSRGTQNPKNTRTTRWAGAYEMRCTAEISAFPQRDRAYDARSGRIPPGARSRSRRTEIAKPARESGLCIPANRQIDPLQINPPISRRLWQAFSCHRRGVPGSRFPITGCAATRGRAMTTSEDALIGKIVLDAMWCIHRRILLDIAEAGCESPIESVMLAALIAGASYPGTGTSSPIVYPKTRSSSDDYLLRTPYWNGTMARGCLILPQCQIEQYRVDFCLIFYGEFDDYQFNLVVECDGHEWHERTKKQAQRDKARDRDLQAGGFIVLRFTGSEIWKNAMGCAAEVYLTAEREYHRRTLGPEDHARCIAHQKDIDEGAN